MLAKVLVGAAAQVGALLPLELTLPARRHVRRAVGPLRLQACRRGNPLGCHRRLSRTRRRRHAVAAASSEEAARLHRGKAVWGGGTAGGASRTLAGGEGAAGRGGSTSWRGQRAHSVRHVLAGRQILGNHKAAGCRVWSGGSESPHRGAQATLNCRMHSVSQHLRRTLLPWHPCSQVRHSMLRAQHGQRAQQLAAHLTVEP